MTETPTTPPATSTINVRLLKPLKDKVVTYQAEVVERDETWIVIRAVWPYNYVDMGYVTFAPGDVLYEYFYADRWYNVYQLCTPDGGLKGWYCNITRPAIISDTEIESEDLEIDVFVSPDRQEILVLDEEEYAMRGIEQDEPDSHQAVVAAIAELQTRATRGDAPFQRIYCTES